jgi:phospholipid transport system substrate-binding protein
MTKLFSIRYIAILLAFSIVPVLTQAKASPDAAKQFIKTITDEAIHVIVDDNISELQKEAVLSSILAESVDTKWISKFTMGRHWRNASDRQKREYQELYKKFLIATYVPKFKEFTNEEIVINKSIKEAEDEYLVQTKIVQEDEKEIEIDYRIRKYEDGTYQIYDVIAEGISLITTQRSEFSSILSRKGVAYLIKQLRKKV